MKKNIALLTMSLNIGGAETHIYELARALHAKGHKVTVFSAGGVYAQKLLEQGISHIEAPLNTKRPDALIKAYRIVSRFVKNNKDCILHSHSRLSNYTAYNVSKRYNVPFISTVHGSYSTGFFQRLLTRWGDRALAVSDDLKNYAADNYGFERDKIRVTVNGINLNTFKKSDETELKRSLGIEQSEKVIVCVTRLDDDADTHIFNLLSIADKIYEKNQNSHIVIIGGGQNYDKLCEIADGVNLKTKDGFIKMLGAQTEIYRYCNIADVFIGISRAALEAMACEVPTVLYGKPGYIGIYSDEVKDICIETNFTCRGCKAPDNDEIIEVVTDILQNPEKYSQNIAQGLNIVKTGYSVDAMASDALTSYTEAQKDYRPYDVMICGYYGRHNLGDDIALEAMTDNLKRECNVQKIALLTADAKHTPTKNIDLFIHRFNLPKIYKYFKKTRLFILGGGSILQDATSERSMFYYLYITAKARKYGCMTMLYSNGVGPINNKRFKAEAAKLIDSTVAATLRDEKSYNYVRSLGVKNKNVYITADEAFTATNTKSESDALRGLDEKYICINLRKSDISPRFLNEFSSIINCIYEKYGYVPVLLPLHYEQDIPVLENISKKLNCKHILIREVLSHDETLAILSKSEFTILERLHAIIFSCIFGKPFIAVNYDPKILSFCIEMGMEDYVLGLASINREKTLEQIDSFITDSEAIADKLKSKVSLKFEKAKLNALIAKEYLE